MAKELAHPDNTDVHWYHDICEPRFDRMEQKQDKIASRVNGAFIGILLILVETTVALVVFM